MIEAATGMVLRAHPLTETSLIIHWLTPKFGRIKTVAKGARRPKSAFRGKLDLFYLADFSFSRSLRSDLHNLREVSVRESLPGIRRDLAYVLQASYCAMLIEQTCESDTPLPEIFELMNLFLHFLPAQPPSALLVLAFEIRLLAELGLMPEPGATRLSTPARQFLYQVAGLDWNKLRDLAFPSNLRLELRQFLHGFLIYHLGRIPSGRSAAWLE